MASIFENFVNYLSGNKKLDSFNSNERPDSFAPPNSLEGEIPVAGGFQNLGVAGTNAANDRELIELYRSIARIPEISEAVDEIVGEMLAEDTDGDIIELDLSCVDLSESIKEKIQDEWKYILNVLGFKKNASTYLRRWYIDGRINFHKIIDGQKVKDGIKELRYINPLSLEKIVEYSIKKKNNVDVYHVEKEYFKYTPGNKTNNISLSNSGNGGSASFSNFWSGTNSRSYFGANQILQVPLNSIAYSTSGIYDEDFESVLSYLHPAIKIANNLSLIEDSMIVYRITRSTEKRIFYIDTGNLPKTKAEQYMADMMSRFKSDINYDNITGKISDAKRFSSITEDIWIPRRESGRATEITTLPGGANLSEMDDVEYFLKKLYRTLKVPGSRFSEQSSGIVGLGRSSEITREELRFQKFIDNLRRKFSYLLYDILKTQIVCKNIMNEKDFDELVENINVVWSKDNFYSEMKDAEILRERISTLQTAEPYVGKFISQDYLINKVMRLDDDEQRQLKKEREEMESQATPEGVDNDSDLPPLDFEENENEQN